MTTYTLQQHRTSGDVHALRYEDEAITGISEPLGQWDIDHWITAAHLPGFGYEPYTGTPDGTGADGFVCWQPPILTTDGRRA